MSPLGPVPTANQSRAGGSAGLRHARSSYQAADLCGRYGDLRFQRLRAVSAARGRKDGLAAMTAVNAKRVRYPPSGGDLVPMAFEDGGRPAEETVAYVRSWGYGLPLGERSEVIRYGWQQLSTRLQLGNAEMIFSSKGF